MRALAPSYSSLKLISFYRLEGKLDGLAVLALLQLYHSLLSLV